MEPQAVRQPDRASEAPWRGGEAPFWPDVSRTEERILQEVWRLQRLRRMDARRVCWAVSLRCAQLAALLRLRALPGRCGRQPPAPGPRAAPCRPSAAGRVAGAGSS